MYTIEEFNTFYGLREVGRDHVIAKFSTRSEAQMYLDRMNAPNYPFSDAMVFCAEHSMDHDICDVIECPNCHISR
jgi:hypothetical protein